MNRLVVTLAGFVLAMSLSAVTAAETATFDRGAFYAPGHQFSQPFTLTVDGESLTVNGVVLVTAPKPDPPSVQPDSPFLRETYAVIEQAHRTEAALTASGKTPITVYQGVLANLANLKNSTIVETVTPMDEHTIVIHWNAEGWRDDPFFYPVFPFKLGRDREAVPKQTTSRAQKLFDEFTDVLAKDGILVFVKPSLYQTGGALVHEQVAPCLDALLATKQPPDPGSDCAIFLHGIIERFLNPPAPDADK